MYSKLLILQIHVLQSFGLLYPEGGSSKILRNVSNCLLICRVQRSRRVEFAATPE